MHKILIIKTGTTFNSLKKQMGDFHNWIISFSQMDKDIFSIIDFNNQQNKVSLNQDIKAAIITGSHSMVTHEEKWIKELLQFIRELVGKKIPILGICFGHQAIAMALGGEVEDNKKGLEIGCTDIFKSPFAHNDPLFKDIPSSFKGHVTHFQSIKKLPEKSVVLASNSHDDFQAFRFKDFCWGLQFHPEFNSEIIETYIEEQRDYLEENKFNIEKIKKGVTSTAHANKIIENFCSYSLKKQ